jgi:hypothetical protein
MERTIESNETEMRPLTEAELDAVAGGIAWEYGCRAGAIRGTDKDYGLRAP